MRLVSILLLLGLLLSQQILRAETSNSLANEIEKPRCDAQRFKIVVDIGHTPQSPGAISARGVPEFAFNSSLGIKIVSSLLRAGFSTKLLESAGLGASQLYERAARANEIKPNLFLSIHHDSVQERYLSQWEFEGETRSFSDKFFGYSIFVASNTVFSEQSFDFAKRLSDALLLNGLTYSIHHGYNIPGENRTLLDANRGIFRNNGLVVLKETRAPSILFEAGIIVNRSEETTLKSADYQTKISNSVVSAAESFCADRQTVK